MGYQKALYQQVLNELSDLRLQNRKAQLARKKKAFDLEPRLIEVSQQIADLCTHLATQVLQENADPQTLTEELIKKSEQLLQEQKALLQKHGLSEDYLKLQYHCNLCQDTGILGTKYCSCVEQRLSELAFSQSCLAAVMDTQDFDHFDFSYYTKEYNEQEQCSELNNMQFNFETCYRFVQSFDSSDENLLLYGGAGLGKTFLSSCIAKDLIQKNKDVFYQSASKIFSILEDYKFGKTGDPNTPMLVDKIYHCDLLIIDDLGAELSTAFSASTLFDILNTRLLGQKRMVINTNVSKNQLLELYSDRVVSRLNGHFTPLKFFGKDIRVQKLYNS